MFYIWRNPSLSELTPIILYYGVNSLWPEGLHEIIEQYFVNFKKSNLVEEFTAVLCHIKNDLF